MQGNEAKTLIECFGALVFRVYKKTDSTSEFEYLDEFLHRFGTGKSMSFRTLQFLRSEGGLGVLCGLLLGEAMEGAKTQDQIDGVDTDDRAVFEQFTQDAQSHAIVRVVERGDKDRGV